MIDVKTVEPTAKYDEFMSVIIKRRDPNISVFIETVLPKNPYMNTSEILEQLDKLKDWLDSFRPFPPAVLDEMKKYYDVNFTYHSNAIEGNTLTKSETQLVLEKGITIGGKSVVEHLEVIGHKEAIDHIEELARQETVIGEREIKDIHNIIMRAIMPEEAGRYRRIDVRASGTDHVYPPHFRLLDLMQEFIAWLQAGETKNLHPIVLATEAHYRLVSIHPFRDGNGRTARLLLNLLLIRCGYPLAVITNERRKDYIDALVYAQNKTDDTTDLINLVAEASRESMIDYLRILSTAGESKGKGLPFYDEMLEFLKNES
ncbi:MAG TPA: Fic family protein [Pyrinomonadaceae bacterium]|nr:Fic family protein [Pyrinomonadaceae bacterium]